MSGGVGADETAADIVDEDVDGAQLVDDLAMERGGLIGVGHVGHYADGLDSERLELGSGGVEGFTRASADGDVHAFARQ